MRTGILRTVAARAAAALVGLITLAALATAFSVPARAAEPAAAPPPAATAPESAAPAADKIFEGQVEAGYHVLDADDGLSRVLPYVADKDGPVLGVDLLYLTPGFGSLRLESGFLTEDTWRAEAEYNHGADVHFMAGTQSFTHARSHLPAAPNVSLGALVEGKDLDPGRTYRDELQESTASVKVRIPGYPAHLSASGRIFTRQGNEQLRYYYRNCTTSRCHMNSRTRELDQETREYTLGLDTHVGPVDLAYAHTARTYRDDAADPVDAIGAFRGGLPAGDYVHDYNPDNRSFSDKVTLNTNLTNRVVLAASYVGGEQENESADLARRTRTAGASLSWRPSASAFVVGRYAYDEQRAIDTSASALALMIANNKKHATDEYTHQHVLEPERTRHTGEISARFSPVATVELGPRVRYRELTRRAILELEGDAYVDETGTTRSTLASLDGRWRPGGSIVLDASVGHEWTENPAYAVETTKAFRYELSGSWTPSPLLLVRAAWQGVRGKNDDAQSLAFAYPEKPDWTDPERTVNADAFSLMASYTPVKVLNLTASWSLNDNGVEQDIVFGGAGYSYFSPDTSWSGHYQVADLRARWAATTRLTLTAGGTWVDSLESYAPNFSKDAGLEEISRVEFTKLLGSLEAEVRLTDAVGLNLAAFWAKYDDQKDDDGDETAQGLLAALGFRW
jgi:hypothetical protein